MLLCISKPGVFLSSIPVPIMDGIMILFSRAIVVVGLSTLVRVGEGSVEPRSLAAVALITVSGVGGMTLNIGSFHLGSIGLAAVAGVLLNFFLPRVVYAHKKVKSE